jgi:hypothetical protein
LLDRFVADAVVAQRRADLVGVGVEALVQRCLLVDLQFEVHAALQIEAKQHRPRAEGGQPVGHGRCEVECDDIVLAQQRPQHVGGAGLRIDAGQAHQHVALLHLDRPGRHARGLERGFDALPQRCIDGSAAVGGDLHRRIFEIDVGQRIQRAQQYHDQNDGVFPAREFEHCDLFCEKRGLSHSLYPLPLPSPAVGRVKSRCRAGPGFLKLAATVLPTGFGSS